MLAIRALLFAVTSIATAGWAADSIFSVRPSAIYSLPKLRPASFCNFPITGALDRISVADLETVTAAAKPHKIYGIEIRSHDEPCIQITPVRRGAYTLLELTRVRGKWQPPDSLVIMSWSQLFADGEIAR